MISLIILKHIGRDLAFRVVVRTVWSLLFVTLLVYLLILLVNLLLLLLHLLNLLMSGEHSLDIIA